MSRSNKFIILACFLFAQNCHAVDAFLDALYWRATETVDWVLTNNLSPPSQIVGYRTMKFDFTSGYRLGVGANSNWDTKFYYTKFRTKAIDSANGDLTSTFLGGKLVQGKTFFYKAGQASLKIDFNMFDFDFAKRFYVNQDLMIRPLLGLRTGWIKQTAITNFQGQTSITETVKNNFSGIGPKAGIEGKFAFYRNNYCTYNISSAFTTSYMFGKWKVSDVLNTSTQETVNIIVGNRKLGALALQAMLGIGIDYKKLSVNLGYEINDWFDQYQVLDDGTGAHNNDLILQGLSLRLTYSF